MKVRAHDRVARRSRGELGVCGGACDWVVEDDEECADVSQSGRSCVVCRVSIFGGVIWCSCSYSCSHACSYAHMLSAYAVRGSWFEFAGSAAHGEYERDNDVTVRPNKQIASRHLVPTIISYHLPSASSYPAPAPSGPGPSVVIVIVHRPRFSFASEPPEPDLKVSGYARPIVSVPRRLTHPRAEIPSIGGGLPPSFHPPPPHVSSPVRRRRRN